MVEWSVTKHGLDVEDVRCAIRRIVASQVYESGDLTKMDAIGFDRQARLLELVATRLDGGTWLFHHADLARPGFVKELLT